MFWLLESLAPTIKEPKLTYFCRNRQRLPPSWLSGFAAHIFVIFQALLFPSASRCLPHVKSVASYARAVP